MDRLRLAVVPTPVEAGPGFHVEIWVNDVEMTSAGAGLGMDSFELLVPVNRFEATADPQRVAVARCECGVYGCGVTDVVVQRVGEVVRWEWLVETPMDRAAEFDADAYDREVRRAAEDRSWETPARTAGRLVLERADRDRLAEHGLQLTAAVDDWRSPDRFTAWLADPGRYQVVVDVDWAGRDPDALADDVCRVLAQDPTTWRARWLGNAPKTRHVPPPMAGPAWQPLPF